jgi:hypothetical protein
MMMMSADYEEQQQQQQQSVPPNHTICNEEIISVDPCSILPHSGSSSIDVSSSFFYWRDLYPELSILIDNIDVIRREARNITMVCCAWMDGWMDGWMDDDDDSDDSDDDDTDDTDDVLLSD